MDKIEDPQVLDKLQHYPDTIRERLLYLRGLIFEVAAETEAVGEVHETLKWGEPSYVTKMGSTIRIDRMKANPDQYAIYFHCKTSLVETFKELYVDSFIFEGNRAIVFHVDDVIPVEELKHCIGLSLRYHKIKHLPMLGV